MYDSIEEFRKDYPFTYVDVGARWGAKTSFFKLFPNLKWIGFEPDPAEFSLLDSIRQKGRQCLPYALGRRAGFQNLYITSSPDWSSLYEPDPEVFCQFNGLRDFYRVTHHYQVPLKTLDELALSHGELLAEADYLKLDVQGAEADVLHGAQTLLTKSLVAVEVEVEFLPIYKGQPLFDQVHKIMMDHGFALFDISRNRCFRSGFVKGIETRGQLIWSDALYLKDFRSLVAESRCNKLLALFLVAIELGFPDYASSILQAMLDNGIANDRIWQEGYQALAMLGANQRRKTRVVDAVAKLPYGKRFLRYIRTVIDSNYDHIVSLAHPEYYFRRD
jgi:FkbM family methyltransferase